MGQVAGKGRKEGKEERRAIVEPRDKNKAFKNGAGKYKGRGDNREEEKTRVYTIGEEDDQEQTVDRA